MTDKQPQTGTAKTVPASGLFGRRSAVPTDLGTHKNAREGAKALFGRRSAEAA